MRPFFFLHLTQNKHVFFIWNFKLVVKGNQTKSLSFGVVLNRPETTSIISETSSVDITDGAKLSKKLPKKPNKGPKVPIWG